MFWVQSLQYTFTFMHTLSIYRRALTNIPTSNMHVASVTCIHLQPVTCMYNQWYILYACTYKHVINAYMHVVPVTCRHACWQGCVPPTTPSHTLYTAARPGLGRTGWRVQSSCSWGASWSRESSSVSVQGQGACERRRSKRGGPEEPGWPVETPEEGPASGSGRS